KVNENGLKLFRDEKLLFQVNDDDVEMAKVYDIYHDGKAHLYCGTKNGLIIYNIKNKKKYTFFENTRITSTMMDIHSNYWLSTIGNGVFQFNKCNLDSILLIKKLHTSDLIAKKN